ncbi:MAG: glycosyltransferase [Anaerolineales bacterium]|nr:glycosyltransferase [Anaerolineales bacterium]
MSTPKLSVLASVYRGEPYLAAYCLELEKQTLFSELEVIFVCNEPSASERKLVNSFQDKYPSQVQVLEVPREPLGVSWNRAWTAAHAPLLAIWNIDDRRLPDSLERQVAAMNQHGWALCFGDYISVPAYGEEHGVRRKTPAYSPAYFARAFAQGGAFWVLRRDIAREIGYFDEQFRVAADMDLSFRIAANKLPMGRVDGVLGYFTDAEQGLSTRAGGQEAVLERTAVQLRYGIFDKVRRDLLPAARRFRLSEFQNFGQWRPMTEALPNYAAFLRLRKPLWLLGYARAAMRSLLARLGLLNWLHQKLDREL